MSRGPCDGSTWDDAPFSFRMDVPDESQSEEEAQEAAAHEQPEGEEEQQADCEEGAAADDPEDDDVSRGPQARLPTRSRTRRIHRFAAGTIAARGFKAIDFAPDGRRTASDEVCLGRDDRGAVLRGAVGRERLGVEAEELLAPGELREDVLRLVLLA